jgi:hypothetical protein
MDEAAPDAEVISYEQWGVDFFLQAITEERVLGAVNTIAGQRIDFGPVGVGPGGIAKARAHGEIGKATATRVQGDQISYRVQLPVALTFEVDLQIEKEGFEAELLVPLTLTAVAMSGVRIFIEAQPPHPDEVEVELEAKGLRASMLQRVADIDGELRRFVARYVVKELDKPEARQARTIDVTRAIGQAWASISPESRRRAGVAADLNEALEQEIREHEETFVGDSDSAGPTRS